VVVELKSVTTLEPIHTTQVMTYLRLAKCWLGLLINFNVPLLKHGSSVSFYNMNRLSKPFVAFVPLWSNPGTDRYLRQSPKPFVTLVPLW
jgi:hypothetical protein